MPGQAPHDLPPTPDFESYPMPTAVAAVARGQDGRILHGRQACRETTGERWLQGCYGERDELLSRLRILARRRRERDNAHTQRKMAAPTS